MRNFGIGKPPEFLRRPLTPTKEDGGTFFSAEATMMALIAAAIVAIILLIIAATAVGASPACMTLQEARAKFPTVHLWWHTRDHCWDNLSGRRRVVHHHNSSDANGNKVKPPLKTAPVVRPVAENEFNELDAQADRAPAIAYPPLISGVGTVRDMLRNDDLRGWPVLMDIDDLPRFEPWRIRVAGAF